MGNFSMLTFVFSVFGAFLGVLVAEYVKHLVRKMQQKERDRDEDLAAIISLLNESREHADKYWTRRPDDLEFDEDRLAGLITASQHRLSRLVFTLFSSDTNKKRNCDIALTKINDAYSGGSFRNPDRNAEPDRLYNIYVVTTAFRQKVTEERRKLPRVFLS